MSEYLDNSEVISFLNICDTYWDTFTLDKDISTQTSLEEFTSLVEKKAEEQNYKTLNFETIAHIINSYRKVIKIVKEKD